VNRSHQSLPPVRILSFVAFCIVHFVSVRGGEFLYGSFNIPSPFWISDSILLCALLFTRQKDWWLWLAAVWPIRLLAGAPDGTPFWFLFFSIAVDSLKGLAAAWWLNRVIQQKIDLKSLHQFVRFLLIAAVAVPLMSALLAAPARHVLGGSYWSAIYRWFLGDSVAQVTVTPTLIYWLNGAYRQAKRRLDEIILIVAGLIGVLYFAFDLPHDSYSPILIYAPVPFLIWAAVRFRPFGTANAMCIVAFASMLSAERGTGVFAGQSLNQNLLSIQLFLLLASVLLLFLSIMIVERENRTQELEALLDAAPIPILIATSPDCQEVSANRAGLELCRATTEANQYERSFAPLAKNDGGSAGCLEQLPLQRAAATGQPQTDVSFTFVSDDGNEYHMLGNASPLLDANGNARGAIGAFLDVTKYKHAESALRESEARFRLVADNAPTLIWMSGTDKLCNYFSKTWLDFTGRTLDQELGNGWAEGVHPDDLDHCLKTYTQAFDARIDFKIEYRLRRRDGEYRWVIDRGVPRFTPEGTFCGYIGSCLDDTERLLSERQMRELSGRLIHAQEQERARIARELHDDLSQRLALLEISADRLRQQESEFSSEGLRQMSLIVQATSEIAGEIRNLSHRLHPPALDTLGLVHAVSGLCREFTQNGLRVQFIQHGVPDGMTADVETCIFRIIQESLRNIVKHARTNEATVELSGNDGFVDLLVYDAGVGFDTNAVNHESGLGLVSMRERLRPIGGAIHIESAPSLGTRIHVSAPAGTPAKLQKRGA
jgi:PAS domain S-box-containing protein